MKKLSKSRMVWGDAGQLALLVGLAYFTVRGALAQEEPGELISIIAREPSEEIGARIERLAAIEKVKTDKVREAIPTLLSLMSRRFELVDVLVEAIDALGVLEAEEAVPFLSSIVRMRMTEAQAGHHPDYGPSSYFQKAVVALGKIALHNGAASDVIQEVFTYYDLLEYYDRIALIDAIAEAKIGPLSSALLLIAENEKIQATQPEVISALIHAFGRMKSKRATAFLSEQALKGDPSNRDAAVRAILEISHTGDAPCANDLT